MKSQNSISSNLPTSFSDVVKDYAELGIDSVLDAGVLRDIPILKTLLSVRDIGVKMRHFLYERKVHAFLEGLREGLNNDEMAIEGFMKGEKERDRFAETAFVLIERYDDIHKPEVMGLLWAACAKGSVSYDQVARLCHLIDRVYWEDLLVLLNFKDGVHASGELAVESLCSVGLVQRGGIDSGTYGSTEEGNMSGGYHFAKTDLGSALVSYGLQKLTQVD
jgi:hypothetical protein